MSPSYKNFQTDNKKYDYKETRTNIFNPEFNPTVSAKGLKESDSFMKNLPKWKNFISWAIWNPDLFLDLITPETGGIRLDLDQRIFLRCFTRFHSIYGVFPRGWSKCVSGDTILFTSDGLKEIGEYFNYIKTGKEFYIAQSIDIINKYGEIENSNKGLYSGYKDTIKIKTEEGYELEGTLNHPILIINKNGDIEFKELQYLTKDDYVLINRKNNIWGNKIDLDLSLLDEWFNSCSQQQKTHLNKRVLPNKIDEEFGLLMGYLIGDGCMTRDNIILFSNKDEDILTNIKNILKNKFDVDLVKKNGDNVDYVVYDKYLRKYFDIIGLKQVNAFEKEVPKCILQSPANIVSKFLQGLFDTDGMVDERLVSLCSVSDKLIKQVQLLLLNFGIISRRTKRKSSDGKFAHNILFIYGENVDKFNDIIGFSCKRKQLKLNKIINKKRNTNKDIIPYQQIKINDFYNDVKLYNKHLYDKVYHILKGNNQLTYSKLETLLQLKNANVCSNYQYLKEINDTKYFFSKVETIEQCKNHVYDLQVPNTNSFVSNGFISHNTFLEVLGSYIVCIFTPDLYVSLTAQTKENASALVEAKHREIIKFYPLLANEVVKAKFSKDSAEIIFTSGSIIDTLANQQSSKGNRRHRLQIEESALLNNELFQDVLEPIVNIPRRTIGKLAVVNAEELNGQINFFTTSGFRGSDEFERNLKMVDEMAELKGKMVLGADWQLACGFGRGETKSQILAKKAKLSPIFFAQNYESKWVGSVENQLVDINKLLNLRTLSKPKIKTDNKNKEFLLGVDVARSQDSGNNQSSVAVIEIKRNKNGKITQCMLVNIITISNALNFTAQALEIKKIKRDFNAKIVIVDSNGLGVGLVDELMKESFDPATGESLGCWDTINTDAQPEVNGAERCIYDLKPQSAQSDIVVAFIDMVESGKLRLLEKKMDADYNIKDKENYVENVLPFIQTNFLVEEIANLQLKHLPSGKVTIEKVIKKYNKDRVSALMYVLWYIKTFEDNVYKNDEDILETLMEYTYF